MGKGDRKTRKGKRYNSSYGNSRPRRRASATGDATARKAQRQDYGGGVVDNHFYLNNCGFFSKNDTLDTVFHIDASKNVKPEIDLESLEKPR